MQPWQELIFEPPTILEVDEFSENHLTVRLLIKTKPLQQWNVGREYRRCLKNIVVASRMPLIEQVFLCLSPTERFSWRVRVSYAI